MAKDNKRLQFIMDMVDKISAPSQKVNKSLQGMGKEVMESQKKLASLNKQAGDISKLAAMRGELERNTKTSKEMAERVQKLKMQMLLTEKPTKAMKDNFRAATKEQSEQLKVSDKHKQALDRLTQSLAKSGVDINRLSESERRARIQIAETNSAIKSQQSALDQATRKQDQMTKAKERYTKAEELSQKAMAAGGKMMVAGAALTGGIVAAGSPNYGFQKQMSAVQAVGDFSDKDRARLTASARAEAKVSSFGAVDAGQAQGYLAAAGFSVDQIEQSLKGVLDLAAATETGLAETADISSNILSGFGLGADQMGRMGDILTATTSGHNVNLQMLGESMKYVAPIAKQTDQSAESIAAMVGLLGDVGIQGSMAGTALKGAMLRLAGPTKDAQKAFDRLNVSTKDANGNVRSMPDVLEELQKKMKGMGSGDKLSLLKRMFGEEPAAAIATLLDKAGNTIAEKTRRLENSAGAANRSARNRLNNLWGDVENFKSSLEDAQIQFGGLLDKMYRGVVRLATAAVDGVNDWMQANPKLAQTLTLVAAALGAVMSVSGALIVGLGALWLVGAKMRLMWFLMRWAATGVMKAIVMKTASVIASTASMALYLVKGAAMLAWWAVSRTAMLAWNIACAAMRGIMVALTAAQWLWNAALTANPIGAVIMAVVALVAAGVWLYQNWERLPEIFSNLWAKITEFVGFDPMAAITGAWDAVGEYFTNLFGGIWDSFMSVFGKIGDKLSSFGSWATGGFGMFDDELKEQVTDAPKPGGDPVVKGKPATKGNQVKPVAPVQNNNTENTYQIVIHAQGLSASEVGQELDRRLAEKQRLEKQQQRARNKD
ncbi:tail length tape-measure protein [Aeromonas phage 13AhydR10PP]|nr:tail length tape-measure protein [Aeromonas phage 13AhydR10PP]